MPRGKYDKHLSVGVGDDLADALDRFAAHRELTRSGAVRWILSTYLHKRGYLRRVVAQEFQRSDPPPDHGVSPPGPIMKSEGEE